MIVSIPKIRLRRPVTDWEGRALIVGGADIPRFEEITFFPRQLSTREMVEIMSAGFTFESLAAGKMPFAPVCHSCLGRFASACVQVYLSCLTFCLTHQFSRQETTPFDTARAVQAAEFAKTEVLTNSVCGSVARYMYV